MNASCSSGDGPARARLRGWALWSINPRGRAYLLAAELLAVVLIGDALAREPATGHDVLRAGVLLLFSVGYAEAADRVERIRRYLGSDQVWSNQISVWAFAGVLILPVGYAGLLVTVIYGHTLLLGRRHQSLRPHRTVFGAATVVLGTFAAAEVYHAVGSERPTATAPGAVAVGLALLTFTAVGLVVMLGGIFLAARPPTVRAILPSRDELTFEIATLILGVVTAEFLLRSPWLSPAVLVLLAVLHRSSLVHQLQVAARTDSKTGLLNARAWQQLAEQHLARSQRDNKPAALLLIDLDHFKKINDTHGHLAGDAALRTVAHCLTEELRGYDAIGRYGGEEFVILLDDVDPATALRAANRVRHCISALAVTGETRVTASIGVATYPADGTGVEQLLKAADAALYRAKAAGRDLVRMHTQPAPT